MLCKWDPTDDLASTPQKDKQTLLLACRLPTEDRGLPIVPWPVFTCVAAAAKARKASVLVTQQSAGRPYPPSAAGKPEAAELGWEGKDALGVATG